MKAGFPILDLQSAARCGMLISAAILQRFLQLGFIPICSQTRLFWSLIIRFHAARIKTGGFISNTVWTASGRARPARGIQALYRAYALLRRLASGACRPSFLGMPRGS
ncbi:MAG: hypothetical protein LBU32_20745 [Clostridiales bacterium]|nr:hypothetical protein [Clostridiales bacterium]